LIYSIRVQNLTTLAPVVPAMLLVPPKFKCVTWPVRHDHALFRDGLSSVS